MIALGVTIALLVTVWIVGVVAARHSTADVKEEDVGLTATIDHEGVVYGAEVATIESTFLGEDHGIFTAALNVAFGCGHTSVGTLGSGTFGAWIMQTLDTLLGAHGAWESLAGRRLFLLYDAALDPYARAGFNCKGIARLDGEHVFIFDELKGEVSA